MKEIFQTRVTSPCKEVVSNYPHGVAVIILNTDNEVLLGVENHAEEHRLEVPIWNILTETWKPDQDVGIKKPLIRALREELSAPMEWFSYIPGTYRETSGAYVITMGYDYKYRCVCLRFVGDPGIPAETLFHAIDGEILTHHWFSLSNLPGTLEVGAKLLINEYRELLRI
jgi:hypothetical protein